VKPHRGRGEYLFSKEALSRGRNDRVEGFGEIADGLGQKKNLEGGNCKAFKKGT